MKVFEDDDRAYVEWVEANPRGFVLTTDRAMKRLEYPMLHLASHRLISGPPGARFTSGDYLKVCSLDVDELESWARENSGRGIVWCKTCAARAEKLAASNAQVHTLVDGAWILAPVVDLLDRTNPTVRCQECFGPVRLHRAGPGGVPRAHAEHRSGHSGCSLGHSFCGTRSLHPDAIDPDGLVESVPTMPERAARVPWTDLELRESVVSYLEMLGKYRAGQSFVRTQYYRALAERFGRSEGSFEYRMQNISFVLSTMGRQWLPGLPPARNVGESVAEKIEALIAEVEGRPVAPVAALAVAVASARRTVALEAPPKGAAMPSTAVIEVTQYIRDPKVKAWVLASAGGVCECCKMPAPFETSEGPFLEVHHVRTLAEGGRDTVCNAVAICPNCHRRLHFGIDAAEQIEALYAHISRLVR